MEAKDDEIIGGVYELSSSSGSSSSSSYESSLAEQTLKAGYARFGPLGLPTPIAEPPVLALMDGTQQPQDRKSLRKKKSQMLRGSLRQSLRQNDDSTTVKSTGDAEGVYDEYGNFWTYDADGKPKMPEWTRLLNGDGVYYFYNWHTGAIRFADPGSKDTDADRAVRKNPHWKAIKRASMDEPELPHEDELTANSWAPKYRGRNWKPKYTPQGTMHWEDRKGRRLANDLPRWFGPVFTHD